MGLPSAKVLVATILWILIGLYCATSLLFIVPDNPATLFLRNFKRSAAPALGQDWRLFAPNLSNVESETLVTVRFADGTESDTISLTRKFHDLAVGGVRRFLPSHLSRVLETAEIELNNASLVNQRVAGWVEQSEQGDQVATSITDDPRFKALSKASEIELETSLATYRNVVSRLCAFVFPEKELVSFRARLIVVFFQHRRRLSEFAQDEASFLDYLEKEIAQAHARGRATLVDTGWFAGSTN